MFGGPVRRRSTVRSGPASRPLHPTQRQGAREVGVVRGGRREVRDHHGRCLCPRVQSPPVPGPHPVTLPVSPLRDQGSTWALHDTRGVSGPLPSRAPEGVYPEPRLVRGRDRCRQELGRGNGTYRGPLAPRSSRERGAVVGTVVCPRSTACGTRFQTYGTRGCVRP